MHRSSSHCFFFFSSFQFSCCCTSFSFMKLGIFGIILMHRITYLFRVEFFGSEILWMRIGIDGMPYTEVRFYYISSLNHLITIRRGWSAYCILHFKICFSKSHMRIVKWKSCPIYFQRNREWGKNHHYITTTVASATITRTTTKKNRFVHVLFALCIRLAFVAGSN